MPTPKEFGKMLRKARLAKKMRTRDLHKATKINEDYLKDLEDGKLTFLPEPYIRAFLRTIANELGLPPEKVLQDFDDILHPADFLWEKDETEAKGQTVPEPKEKKKKKISEQEKKSPEVISKKSLPEEKKASQKSVAPSTKADHKKTVSSEKVKPSSKPGSKTSNKTEVLLVVAVAIIFLSVGYIYWKYGRQYFVEKKEPVREITVFEAHDDIVKHEEQAKKAQHVTPSVQKQETKSGPTPQKVKLHIVTLDTTWLRVIRDGKDTSEYIFRPGNTRDFEADSLIQLKMGRADGLRLWVNGDSLGTLGSSSQVVRKLVIDRKGIREKKLWRPKPIAKN
ncbi:MAG: helix-turn-helix domain-containing protein [Calditrichaeota bacterium]|nr:helix-turn-helix domain-containing protein [Calditrichota bacterium]